MTNYEPQHSIIVHKHYSTLSALLTYSTWFNAWSNKYTHIIKDYDDNLTYTSHLPRYTIRLFSHVYTPFRTLHTTVVIADYTDLDLQFPIEIDYRHCFLLSVLRYRATSCGEFKRTASKPAWTQSNFRNDKTEQWLRLVHYKDEEKRLKSTLP